MSQNDIKNYTLTELIRFDTVDGLFLRENEVDQLQYFLIDDEFMQKAMIIQNDIVIPTTTNFENNVATLVELRLDGNTAAKNYSKYDHFIECDDFVEALDESITILIANGRKNELSN